MDSDVNLDSAPFQSVKYSSASPDLGEYFTAHFPNDDPALDATDSSVVDDLRRQLKVNRQSDLYILKSSYRYFHPTYLHIWHDVLML